MTNRSIASFCFVIAGWLALVAILTPLGGCSKPYPIPPPLPPVDYDLADCPLDMELPHSSDVCGNLETPEHLRCVRCEVKHGCLLRQAKVYCAVTCFDPACRPAP